MQVTHASHPSFVIQVIEIFTLCELQLMGSQAHHGDLISGMTTEWWGFVLES